MGRSVFFSVSGKLTPPCFHWPTASVPSALSFPVNSARSACIVNVETLRFQRDRIDLQPLRTLVRAVEGRLRRTLARSHHMQHDPQLETRADLQDTLPDRLRPGAAPAPRAHAWPGQIPLATPTSSSSDASPVAAKPSVALEI